MKVLRRRLLGAAGHAMELLETPHNRRSMRWLKSNYSDPFIRLDWNLTEKSIVFDVGAYRGDWTNFIFAQSLATVHAFDPVYGPTLLQHFKNVPKIHVHPYGLGGETRSAPIAVNGGSSSFCYYPNHPNVMKAEICSFQDFLRDWPEDIESIDLMKINSEGSEFELLEEIIRLGWHKRIRNFQIQFHDFMPRAVERRQAIAGELNQSHTRVYYYPWVWEVWRLDG
jgi:FkbM family methyltransferase